MTSVAGADRTTPTIAASSVRSDACSSGSCGDEVWPIWGLALTKKQATLAEVFARTATPPAEVLRQD